MSTRSAFGAILLLAFIVGLLSYFVFNVIWITIVATVVFLALGSFYFFLSLE